MPSPRKVQQQGVRAAAACLEQGGLILFPTDTVWSVGGDGTDPVTVERLCNLRGHRHTGDFELLVHSFPMLYTYVEPLHPRLETLLIYHRRPLALFCRGRQGLPGRLLQPDGQVAVRMVRDDYSRRLIEYFGRPLVTAFAARAGHPPPDRLESVHPFFLDKVDYVSDAPSAPEATGSPAVLVSLSEKEDLIFHRE